MSIVIVPNDLRDAINKKLDAAFINVPGAESERDNLYSQLLGYYDEHGVIPDFELTKKDTETVIA